jgi:carotenoid cleavage dioxygenase-like enzyme
VGSSNGIVGTESVLLRHLNADDVEGEAQAVIDLPQRVPAGFHGNWVPDPT